MKNYHIKNNTSEFFEGWYFKHQSLGNTISFIPGVHIPKSGKPLAFIQIITPEQSYFIKYPYKDFYAQKKALFIKIGPNVFSKHGIFIDINTPKLKIRGSISYAPFTPVKYDIMGPFSLIPNMECNHGIISLHHSIYGYIKINNKGMDFNNGTGYIEKDWGRSFPKSYTWLQCNDFTTKCSITVSIAHIPFYGLEFQGLIGIVYYKGREYRFATYNGAKVVCHSQDHILLKKGRYVLRITLPKGEGHPLLAPNLGDMSRVIHQRPSCPARFDFFIDRKKVFSKNSDHASFEYVAH